MKYSLPIVCCLFFIGCNSDQKTSNTATNTKDSSAQQPGNTAPAKTVVFAPGNFDKNTNPFKDSIKGNIINGASWMDVDGEQQVLLTETANIEKKENGTQNKQLYAYCFIKTNGSWKQKWLVQDRIDDCEVDATCEFFPASLSVTDVDGNNTGEVSFIYKKSCRGDVSPDDKKLIMYEGLNKYAIRGSTILHMAGEKQGGTKKMDAAFSNADKALTDHANSQWDKFGIEKY